MSFLVKKNDFNIAIKLYFTDDFICLELSDGREVKTPLVFYPRLLNATPKEREHFRFIGGGEGIHWDLLDEDLSVESIVMGRKSVV